MAAAFTCRSAPIPVVPVGAVIAAAPGTNP